MENPTALVIGASLAVVLATGPVSRNYLGGNYWIPAAVMLAAYGAFKYFSNFTIKSNDKPCIHVSEWTGFKLIKKKAISHNTAIYKFELPTPKSKLGLPIGQHVSIQCPSLHDPSKKIMRSYSPISEHDQEGCFELLIKTYDQGNASQYISNLPIGEKVMFRGPKGEFFYTKGMCIEIGMIAGGTGITPMLPIIKTVLKDPSDETKISLIFANVTFSDIHLKAVLDSLVYLYPTKFKVHYVLSKPTENWEGGVGRVNKEMIQRHLPSFGNKKKILLCGPPAMCTDMAQILEELGWPKCNAFSKIEDHQMENPKLLVVGAALGVLVLVTDPLSKSLLGTENSWLTGAIVGALYASYGGFKFFTKPTTKPCIDKTEWTAFKLIGKKSISPNTAIYKFELPTPTTTLGLPIGQHISIQSPSMQDPSKMVMRSYTPISEEEEKGFFELLIKTYEQGNASQYVSKLKLGEKVLFRGPKGAFLYRKGMCKEIGMIAGGTGITPMLQIIKTVLKNPSDDTKISLIFANVTFTDILLKSVLDSLVNLYPTRFKVYYVLNTPPEHWEGGVGFVNKEMIETHLPSFGDKKKILICGPPPMCTAMTKILEETGWPKCNALSKVGDAVFKF